jgi:hypothetical protein
VKVFIKCTENIRRLHERNVRKKSRNIRQACSVECIVLTEGYVMAVGTAASVSLRQAVRAAALWTGQFRLTACVWVRPSEAHELMAVPHMEINIKVKLSLCFLLLSIMT